MAYKIVDPGERHAADQYVYNYLEYMDRLTRHMDKVIYDEVLDDDLLRSALEYRSRMIWWQNQLVGYAHSHLYDGVAGRVTLEVWYE